MLPFRYGYYDNQHSNNNGYYFSKPQYQDYPYSQQDIAPSHGYQQQPQSQHEQSDHPGYDYSRPQRLHTTVEIQRSHGYEIKPEDQEYRTIFEEDEYQRYLQAQRDYQHQHLHSGRGYEAAAFEGPVIVLRVPGPSKYAAHLQALLQQYLEVRAAQYIQALQEEEARGQAHQYAQPQQEVSSYHPQPHNAHAYVQQSYGTPLFQANHEQQHAIGHEHGDEGEQVQHHPSLAEAPIVYQGDENQQQQYQGGYEQVYDTESKHIEASHEEPQPYSYEPPQQSADLLTHENYPDTKHTQVIFKDNSQQPHAYLSHHNAQQHDHLQQHQQHQHYLHETTAEAANQQAQLQGQSPHAPLVYQQLEQYYGEEEEFQPSSGEPHAYASQAHNQHIQTSSEPENYVTITQRPHEAPYNYHAHPLADSDEYVTTAGETRGAKRQAHFTEDQMKKFSAIMTRMKKKLTSLHGQADQQH